MNISDALILWFVLRLSLP